MATDVPATRPVLELPRVIPQGAFAITPPPIASKRGSWPSRTIAARMEPILPHTVGTTDTHLDRLGFTDPALSDLDLKDFDVKDLDVKDLDLKEPGLKGTWT